MSALVEVGYDVDMGVSVYVKDKPLHKGDYVTHYAVKWTMIVEEYASIMTIKRITHQPFPTEREGLHVLV